MEQRQQQQRQGGDPPVAQGEVYPVDRLPVGLYVCSTKGEAKRAYGDYRRMKTPRDFPREEEEKVPSAPMKESSDVGRLLPGAYVCSTKGEAKRALGDYRRIGEPATEAEQPVPSLEEEAQIPPETE